MPTSPWLSFRGDPSRFQSASPLGGSDDNHFSYKLRRPTGVDRHGIGHPSELELLNGIYVHGNERDANSITIARESAEARAAERRELWYSIEPVPELHDTLPQTSTMSVVNPIDNYQFL